MCSQHFQLLLGQEVDNLYDSLVTSSQQSNYASSSTDNALTDMEIFAYPEHQLPLQQVVAQIEAEVDQMEEESSSLVPPTTLKAEAVPFTPKEKGRNKRVSYADAVKQDSNSDTSRLSSPSSNIAKKKNKTAPVLKTNLSSNSRKAPKKQPATPAPKTISTVMTRYDPKFKENIREITVYDILSRWTQLDVLNHLKA
ncbi:hypothetical protein RhiirA4_419604 [Rhizophagus irregularis]|uniref:Uncharacterized protein n=1 Tax=Rhizophagus irregularis TaxID=588596 RepID=A0A2I1GEX2_9GLOM|nr:hypothetical protein RhiirA4_419604 [Rhizophagus irregularis]